MEKTEQLSADDYESLRKSNFTTLKVKGTEQFSEDDYESLRDENSEVSADEFPLPSGKLIFDIRIELHEIGSCGRG